jgi:hypothetical protein
MIHNVHFSQYLPPTNFHTIPSTNITWTAGAVTGTIAQHKAAAAETIVCTIPIEIPSNAVALQGAKLTSIEIDYQLGIADATSVTAVLNKVTRGADLAVAVVSAVTQTQSPTAALSKVFDKHKLIITLTTPEWVLNTVYYLMQLTFVCPATTTLDLLGAVANFTFRA